MSVKPSAETTKRPGTNHQTREAKAAGSCVTGTCYSKPDNNNPNTQTTKQQAYNTAAGSVKTTTTSKGLETKPGCLSNLPQTVMPQTAGSAVLMQSWLSQMCRQNIHWGNKQVQPTSFMHVGCERAQAYSILHLQGAYEQHLLLPPTRHYMFSLRQTQTAEDGTEVLQPW
jgi:hypothetical protein